MKIKTLIVDDEAPARRRLRKLLSEEDRCELVGEAENGIEAIHFIQNYSPQLVLLDIQLKDMTGLDVLTAVASSFKGELIFITAFDAFAIKAFEANAVDYLLKPFKNERFQIAINRALKAIEQNAPISMEPLLAFLAMSNREESVLLVPEGKTMHRLPLKDILYIKAEGYYSHFQMEQTHKMIRISLKKLESLVPSHFVRINKSVMINKDKISWTKELKKTIEIEMVNGEQFIANKQFTFLGALHKNH
ncbi:MAG: response regulator transcription factor [Saprospiraceae bacterium]